MFIKILSQQPDGQVHKQHKIQTKITNKRDTYEMNTYKTNHRILKLLIIRVFNNKIKVVVIISNLSVIICLLNVST